MNTPISPWEDTVSLRSPNGLYEAKYTGSEIRMGSPTSGTLALSNGFTLNTNASMIWSDDSKYLAVALWTNHLDQELAIIDVSSKKIIKKIPGFRVIELHSFNRRIIVGIDSPIQLPKQISLDVSDLI